MVENWIIQQLYLGLTSFDQFQINLELNDYKENEMTVHPESQENNQYFNYNGTIEAEARNLKKPWRKMNLIYAYGKSQIKTCDQSTELVSYYDLKGF